MTSDPIRVQCLRSGRLLPQLYDAGVVQVVPVDGVGWIDAEHAGVEAAAQVQHHCMAMIAEEGSGPFIVSPGALDGT